MFRDRQEAGRMLAEALAAYSQAADTIVLGIPRGGVIVAEEVARRLDLPLDVVITSKIGAPGNEEYAIGAVDPAGLVTSGHGVHYSADEIEMLALPVREKIHHRLAMYRGDRDALQLSGATVILVDDGIATGLTAIAALRYLRGQGASALVLGVPVIPARTAGEIADAADEIVALETPELFSAVGQFYRHFTQTSDDEVLEALERTGSVEEQ